MNGAHGRLRSTVNTPQAASSRLTARGETRSIGIALRPSTRFAAHATYAYSRNGTANTKIAWCRAACGMLPCIRYQAARVPPQPGQSNPVVSLMRHVGELNAVRPVGSANSV